jgi:hypothetical protein
MAISMSVKPGDDWECVLDIMLISHKNAGGTDWIPVPPALVGVD